MPRLRRLRAYPVIRAGLDPDLPSGLHPHTLGSDDQIVPLFATQIGRDTR